MSFLTWKTTRLFKLQLQCKSAYSSNKYNGSLRVFPRTMYVSVILILNVFLQASTTTRQISIDTSFGTFIGLSDDRVEFNGETKSCVKFLGIPFAKPPMGDRRFSRPEPEVGKRTPHDATFYRPHCPQSEIANPYIKYFNSSEDCLYLNIFVPGDTIKTENRFPVMIWVYGGIFAHGGADIYSGDILSAYNDVIVVTFNYRMNVFGFLDNGSGEFANNGLFDQKLAIDWVYSHIRSFGGNTDQITLFGESAGGVSVIYQSLHRDNEGKVKRIIAQSGSPLASYAYQPNPKTLFDEFCLRVNCIQDEATVKLECLRNKSVSELVSKLKMLDQFLPSIDNEFLTSDPKAMLADNTGVKNSALRRFSEIDFMTGINNKDGGSLILNYWAKFHRYTPLADGITRSGFERFAVPISLRQVFGPTNDALVRATIHQYSDWDDPMNKQTIRDKIIDLSTDLYFLVPAIRIADKHADTSSEENTYFYQFSHRPWLMKQHKWLEGALHAWEIPYVFGLTDSLKIGAGLHPDTDIVRPVQDNILSQTMMRYWTNFAKNGNPNLDNSGKPQTTRWPKYNSDSHSYVDFTLSMTSRSVKQHLQENRVRFWTDVAPALLEKCSDEKKYPNKCFISQSSNTKYEMPSGSAASSHSVCFAYLVICLSACFSRNFYY